MAYGHTPIEGHVLLLIILPLHPQAGVPHQVFYGELFVSSPPFVDGG
jgi:hypothetical protein